MPRPRKNPTLAALDGRGGRYKSNQPPVNSPVGDPPDHLRGSRRDAWYELCLELPALTIADRTLLEVAATIRGDMVTGDMGIAKMALLRNAMKDLGGSPVDRVRLNLKPEEPEDPEDAFFNED